MDQITSDLAGISTAAALTLLAMPSSILFDTAPPVMTTGLLASEQLPSALSSLFDTYSTPSVPTYTVPGLQGITVQSTPTAVGTVPDVASFYNSDGSVVATTLPSDRLGTAITGAATGMMTSASNEGIGATPSAYNPGNAASVTVKVNGVLLAALAISVLLF